MCEDRRIEAIKKIKEIQEGKGLLSVKFPENRKGSIPKDIWHEPEFSLGMEYGYIFALLEEHNLFEEFKNYGF